jgi:tetratricopeptide (TPR) repeat protein
MDQIQQKISEFSTDQQISKLKLSKHHPQRVKEFITCFQIKPNASLLPLSHLKVDYLYLREKQNQDWAYQRTLEGTELARSKDYVSAIKKYDLALDLDPTCVEAFVARGAALANQQKYIEAIADLQIALELDPKHKNANAYLKKLLKKEQERIDKEAKRDESLLNGEFILVF